MTALEYLGLTMSGLLVVVTLLLTRHVYRGALFWCWAWVAQILTGVANTSSDAALISAGLSSLFPLLQLAGVLDYLKRPIPLWLPVIGAAVILLKLLVAGLGMPLVAADLTSALEIPLLVACAVWLSLKAEPSFNRNGMIAGFGALAVLEAYDAILENLSGLPYFDWRLWGFVMVPLAAVQIVTLVERARKARDESASEQLARRAAEDRFGALVRRSKDVIAEIDAGGKLAYVSPNVQAILGVPAEQLIHKDLAELAEIFSPEADMHTAQPTLSDELDGIVAAGPYASDYIVTRPDGEKRWVEISSSDYKTRDGQLHVVAVLRDVTQRRRLELEATRTQKLDSLELMAAGVAHDFNNLLAAILGNAELARLELNRSEKEALNLRLESLEGAALQARALTLQLLQYAGKGTMEPRVVDVSRAIAGMQELLAAVAGDAMELQLELEANLPPIKADTGQLQQVLMNLITNARDACPRGGRIALSTGACDELPNHAVYQGATHAEYICITVTDNGEGMSADMIPQIFDPFFTTRFDGRGLGLASVFGVLRMLGGAIAVDSEPGQGSTFRIYLPVTLEALPADEKDAGLAHAGPDGTGKADELPSSPVLVIDDADLPRDLVCRMLRASGVEVMAAAGGEEALSLVSAGQRVSCVLTDLAMPGLSGAELIDQLRIHLPDVPIILMSGYNRTIAQEKLGKTTVSGFLQKPFRLSDLLDELEAVSPAG